MAKIKNSFRSPIFISLIYSLMLWTVWTANPFGIGAWSDSVGRLLQTSVFNVQCASGQPLIYGASGLIFFCLASAYTYAAISKKYGNEKRIRKPEPILILFGLLFFTLPFSYEIIRACSASERHNGTVILIAVNNIGLLFSPFAFAGSGLLISAGIRSFMD